MSDHFSIEDLIIDDSFANYCFQKNEKDILFWEGYLNRNPTQKETIEEAMQIVLGLNTMLLGENISMEGEAPAIKTVPLKPIGPAFRKIMRISAAVAAAVLLIMVIKLLPGPGQPSNKGGNNVANWQASDEPLEFATGKGEKREFTLPDSTRVHLNAGSRLSIRPGFGNVDRSVYLTGEALFDVAHNESLPFIVHLNNYDVKVLGTLFNVKAYPGDQHSETSLIRGKVEIRMANSDKRLILEPDQKAVINMAAATLISNSTDAAKVNSADVSLVPLSHNEKDNTVIETAWSVDRLEIVDESFEGMKDKLERWYNVKLIFKDQEVGKYTFTATFEGETIEEVLKAFQFAYPFNYSIKENEVTLWK